MNHDPLCTEDMIEELLVLLIDIADEFRREPHDQWPARFLKDPSLVIQLSLLTMAQSMLNIDGKVTDVVRLLTQQEALK